MEYSVCSYYRNTLVYTSTQSVAMELAPEVNTASTEFTWDGERRLFLVLRILIMLLLTWTGQVYNEIRGRWPN